jgi:hypothetical protein
MARLDEITAPRPLAELLDVCFTTYRERHPWVDASPSPKSILREMLESGDTFATFVRRYRLDRSEGLLLRYLTDAWRTLDRSLPDGVFTDALEDVVTWLGQLIRATDATLLEEWERLAGVAHHDHVEPTAPTLGPPGPPAAWRTAVRTAAFGWVDLLARRSHAALADRCGWTMAQLDEAMAPYWAEHTTVFTDADARSTAMFELVEEPDRWVITQRLADPAGSGEWRFVAFVPLAESLDEGAPRLVLQTLGHLAA